MQNIALDCAIAIVLDGIERLAKFCLRNLGFDLILYILSTAVAYLCVIAAQHILNDPRSEIYTSKLPVPVPCHTVVYG